MKLSRPLIVLDLETTGTWIEKDRIVEIALLRLELDGASTTFMSRVNPGMPIPPRVSQIIGITDADVKDAPAFAAIAPKVLAFLGDADLGGFALVRAGVLITSGVGYLQVKKFLGRGLSRLRPGAAAH